MTTVPPDYCDSKEIRAFLRITLWKGEVCAYVGSTQRQKGAKRETPNDLKELTTPWDFPEPTWDPGVCLSASLMAIDHVPHVRTTL